MGDGIKILKVLSCKRYSRQPSFLPNVFFCFRAIFANVIIIVKYCKINTFYDKLG